MNFLDLFFGHPNSGGKPHPSPAGVGRNAAANPAASRPGDDQNDGLRLTVAKAVTQLDFVARSYGFTVFSGTPDDLKADLFTMASHRDLKHVQLELIGADGRVAFVFCLRFDTQGRPGGNLADTGRGIELPVLDRQEIKDHRLIVQQRGGDAKYRHLLRLKWNKAETIRKSAGGEYRSDHADVISGGRLPATFHVSDAARHHFIISRTGTRNFLFAQDLDTGRDGVFALLTQFPAGFDCRVGTRFTGVLIAVPKGFQVRDIRAA